MSAIKNITLTLYGQRISGIEVAVGTTVNWLLTLQDPDTRAAIDLTSTNVTMGLCALDSRGNAKYPPLISRQATITNAVAGQCTVPWADGDTAPVGAPLAPGSYGISVWWTDASGNRFPTALFSEVTLAAAGVLPDTVITPLPSQSPLAQGPQGPSGTSAVTVTGSAAIDAGALIKVSGTSTYATLGAADDPSLMVGVAVTACGGASQSFTAQLVPGTVTTMLSDGTGTIANGASVCPSTTVAGRIKSGTTNSVGVNVGALVAATLNASVSVL